LLWPPQKVPSPFVPILVRILRESVSESRKFTGEKEPKETTTSFARLAFLVIPWMQ
jgi:hypothetical protein